MIISRIKKFLDENNISISAFEKTIGTANGTIRNALKNKTEISSKYLSLISVHYPELDFNWLVTGEGKMIRDSKKPVMTMELEAPVYKYKPDSLATIPLVSTEAIAGFGNLKFSINEKDVLKNYSIPEFAGVSFLIRVKGDSMHPKYTSGDIVGGKKIENSNFIQWGKPYIIATQEQGILIKYLYPSDQEDSLKAVSENEKYPAFDIPKSEITGLAIIRGVIRFE
ncbi:S24 family peptidase [Flammeovirga aprica]|uniref:LexA family transcriptional regulator n=1 Tax=Flammeovirga aprica JL-4 TaxID=694437 RepID=A0A7X9RUP0_9BACT|nr:LexA family transcriptional regulator [Flammeovirga aprica]NME69038.1 LexA family transcriptional regulator [Flammeovirga aprica JL-4]